ncbi:hypothetical protein [Sutcliffiella horikoshii]|uniref:hypothetical protein n=1 Tax=Sutcliffiella horikoshii TaxID=79883 RepID=UPI00384EA7E3
MTMKKEEGVLMDVMKTSLTMKKEEGVLMDVMKTSVTRKKNEGGPHGRDEDLSDEETGGERCSWSV